LNRVDLFLNHDPFQIILSTCLLHLHDKMSILLSHATLVISALADLDDEQKTLFARLKSFDGLLGGK